MGSGGVRRGVSAWVPPPGECTRGGPAPPQDSRQCHRRGLLGRVCATLLPKWSQAPVSSASEGQADEQTNSCSACEQRGVGTGFAPSDPHTCNYEMSVRTQLTQNEKASKTKAGILPIPPAQSSTGRLFLSELTMRYVAYCTYSCRHKSQERSAAELRLVVWPQGTAGGSTPPAPATLTCRWGPASPPFCSRPTSTPSSATKEAVDASVRLVLTTGPAHGPREACETRASVLADLPSKRPGTDGTKGQQKCHVSSPLGSSKHFRRVSPGRGGQLEPRRPQASTADSSISREQKSTPCPERGVGEGGPAFPPSKVGW